MRSALLVGCTVLICSAARAEASAFWKGIASAVVPGSGQAMNGDRGEAASHFGLFGVPLYAALRQRDKDDFLDEDTRYDEDNDREAINRTTLRYDSRRGSRSTPRFIPLMRRIGMHGSATTSVIARHRRASR